MLTRFGSVLRQYPPTSRTAITWVLVARAKVAAVTMADNRTEAILPTGGRAEDRKSTRLNSSHQIISYAVFCLKKKKHQINYVIYVVGYSIVRESRTTYS